MVASYDYIFVLGVGKKFTSIIDKFYQLNSAGLKRPKIGGWMNAYSLNNQLNQNQQNTLTVKFLKLQMLI
jgi:hypothetical protein